MKKLSLLLMLFVFTGASCNLFQPTTETPAPADTNMMEEDAVMDKGDTMMEENDSMEALENDSMMEENDAMDSDANIGSGVDVEGMMDEMGFSGDTAVMFSGKVLAGSSSPLLEFNESDYQKALASDKLIVLYFYANWCPICVAEFPRMEAVFSDLQGSDVVGFRVHFNDDQVTDFQEELAREFGVAYQHTKVMVKNGNRVLKSPESWDESRYRQEIESHR